jgi:hypothetical protein
MSIGGGRHVPETLSLYPRKNKGGAKALQRIKTYSIKKRESKVKVRDFSRPMETGQGMNLFFDSIPNILAGKTLRTIIKSVVSAHKKHRGVIWAIGAHVIKCGLNPVLIDLIENEIITALVVNGACLVHDFEIAFFGKTSEDVEEGLKAGEFGMARETGKVLNKAINEGVQGGLGIGEGVGRWILEKKPDFLEYSILARAVKTGIPVTAHIAIGTDIIHMHPEADGESLGKGGLRDFHNLTMIIKTLDEGGIYFNIGSAVILPEVFLKAITMVINLGNPLKDFTTVNMDFIQHYRPTQNVVKRPVLGRGKGYTLIGHHEIMIPLLAAGIKEGISAKDINEAGQVDA